MTDCPAADTTVQRDELHNKPSNQIRQRCYRPVRGHRVGWYEGFYNKQGVTRWLRNQMA